MLASVLSCIYVAALEFLQPGALITTEYCTGFAVCFLLAWMFGSTAEKPTEDMAFFALLKALLPLSALGLLGYGVWLWRYEESIAEMGAPFAVATGTYGFGIILGCVASGLCLVLMAVHTFRRE